MVELDFNMFQQDLLRRRQARQALSSMPCNFVAHSLARREYIPSTPAIRSTGQSVRASTERQWDPLQVINRYNYYHNPGPANHLHSTHPDGTAASDAGPVCIA
ncbi:hypothetical protein AC579_1113 [Pseudocercospora musae]|uniref:Uncharacterized protein n=1 Tax=Pseudocercospora musae TaxID=113226 RepID=A0A139HZY4_9PEZI|nr:hypothetical protein AC579_1113 [Pseudocercospora musae]